MLSLHLYHGSYFDAGSKLFGAVPYEWVMILESGYSIRFTADGTFASDSLNQNWRRWASLLARKSLCP